MDLPTKKSKTGADIQQKGERHSQQVGIAKGRRRIQPEGTASISGPGPWENQLRIYIYEGITPLQFWKQI